MTVVLDTTKKAAPAAPPRQRPVPRAKPVSVNGVTIPRGDIARETQNHPAEKPVEAWTAAARALVVRELLLQEARRLAIESNPATDGDRRETDDEAIVRALVEREVKVPEADEAACRRIYEQQADRFRSPDLYMVRHILIPAAPADVEARVAAKTRAQSVIEALAAKPAAFTDFASAYSACPSKAQGGQLGQISHGQTVPEFEAALADAPVGEVTPTPVETRYGFHVVIVDHRIEGEVLPFAVVHGQIAEWLSDRAEAIAIRQYIMLLAGRATITGIDFEGSGSALVQ